MSRAAAAVAGGGSSGTSEQAKPKSPAGGGGAVSRYFRCTELPLTSLAFLLPLVILYEVGTRAFTFDPVHQTEQRIRAFVFLQRFFQLCGASGRYLPALSVVGVLLAWHIARGDSWKVRLGHLVGMGLECVLIALPLITLSRVAEQYLAHVTLFPGWDRVPRPIPTLMVLSLGAGVYEELVFRLMGFAVLSFLFVDVLSMRKRAAALLVVLVSSVAFSGYHYLEGEAFVWWTFAFRSAAGLYLGIVFICRGFGITAGAHAAYDLCCVGLWWLA
jgi:hypothetical protein